LTNKNSLSDSVGAPGGAPLSDAEMAVINTLASAWNQFIALPVQHKHEAREFTDGIHRLQDLVAARPGYRGIPVADPGGAPTSRAIAPDLECPRCGGSGRIANPAATGDLFRRARTKMGLTLREAARRMGISAAYLSDLERGNRAWTLKVQTKMGKLLKREANRG
jgi:DNA-binding XRE family transcriptional regulator